MAIAAPHGGRCRPDLDRNIGRYKRTDDQHEAGRCRRCRDFDRWDSGDLAWSTTF
jgi:hypothetical protein